MVCRVSGLSVVFVLFLVMRVVVMVCFVFGRRLSIKILCLVIGFVFGVILVMCLLLLIVSFMVVG